MSQSIPFVALLPHICRELILAVERGSGQHGSTKVILKEAYCALALTIVHYHSVLCQTILHINRLRKSTASQRAFAIHTLDELILNDANVLSVEDKITVF